MKQDTQLRTWTNYLELYKQHGHGIWYLDCDEPYGSEN